MPFDEGNLTHNIAGPEGGDRGGLPRVVGHTDGDFSGGNDPDTIAFCFGFDEHLFGAEALKFEGL